MASIMYRNGRAIGVRAYAGKDPIDGHVCNLYEPLPIQPTQKDINDALARIQALADFCKANNVDMRVKDMIEFYFTRIGADGHSPTTLDTYRSNARCYLYPYLGDRLFSSLKPYMFSSLYTFLLSAGGKDGKPISANTVLRFHAWLKAAFDFFVGSGLILYNPLSAVTPPKRVHKEVLALSEQDHYKLLDYLCERIESGEATTLDRALYVDLNTGFRAGELAALHVGDYLRMQCRFHIRSSLAEVTGKGLVYKTPKSKKGARYVPVDEDCGRVVLDQIEYQEAALGGKQTDDTPLFAKSDGSPYAPRDFNLHLKEIAKETGMNPHVHLHQLRHTHATVLLAGGMDMYELANRFGHAGPNVTLSIYAHAVPGHAEEAVEIYKSYINRMESVYRRQGKRSKAE